MKLLMKIFSIVLSICFIMAIVNVFTELSGDFAEIYVKGVLFLTTSIIPIILICVCCANSKKTEKFLVLNISMAIAIFTIILTAIMTFAPIENFNQDILNVLVSIWNFLTTINTFLLMFALLYSVQPNNTICKTIQILGYGAIAISLITQIILIIQEGLIKLPNEYGDSGFNFLFTLNEGNEFLAKVTSISTITLLFSIALTYITNYAFEFSMAEIEELDYNNLKKEADKIVQSKIDELYKPKEEEFIPDRSASEKGLMNVNNQLGINSNVGQVNGPMQQNTFVDRAIPTSNGPVINQSLNNYETIQQPIEEKNTTNNINTNPSLNNFQPVQEQVNNSIQTEGKFISNNMNINNQQQINNINPSISNFQPIQGQVNNSIQTEGKFISNDMNINNQQQINNINPSISNFQPVQGQVNNSIQTEGKFISNDINN